MRRKRARRKDWTGREHLVGGKVSSVDLVAIEAHCRETGTTKAEVVRLGIRMVMDSGAKAAERGGTEPIGLGVGSNG